MTTSGMFKAQVAQLRHLVAEMEYLMVLMAIEIYCLIWVLFGMKFAICS